MNNITIFTVVYNEERRIECLLRNCLWSNDIIIYDKSSTDKTAEIASRYLCKIINIPSSASGSKAFGSVINIAKNEWILFLTCSDIIHPGLVDKMLELINRKDFDYDRIVFPSISGVFGIIDKKSPWSPSPLWMSTRSLFRKDAVIFTEVVHKEIQFKSDRIYWTERNETEALFHLTHEDLDTYFERHIRYARAEAQLFESRNKGLWKSFWMIFIVSGWMILKKRTLFLGWKGVFLFLAYLSYYINIFLFTYQQFDGKGKEEYGRLRKEMLDKWREWHQRNGKSFD